MRLKLLDEKRFGSTHPLLAPVCSREGANRIEED